MTRIKRYKTTPVTSEDTILGTQTLTGKTVNFSIEDIVDLVETEAPETIIDEIDFKGAPLPVTNKTVTLPSKLSEFEEDLGIDKKIEDWSIRNVENIQELRNIEGVEGQKVNLLGYYVAGDNINVLYEYSETPTHKEGEVKTQIGYWVPVSETNETSNSGFKLRFDGYQNEADYNSSEPKLTRTPTGDVLLSYRKCNIGFHNHNSGNIYGKISKDEGVTFGEEFTLVEDELDIRNFVIGNINGITTIVYRIINSTPSGVTHVGLYYKQTSDLINWTPQKQLNTNGTKSVVPFGKMVEKDGKLQFLMYAQRNPNSTCHLYEIQGSEIKVIKEVYNITTDLILSEPVMEYVEGRAVIIVRNGNQQKQNISFYEIYENNLGNYSEPVESTINGDVKYSDTPAWVDYNKGFIIVYTNYRIGSVNEGNKKSYFRVYIKEVGKDLDFRRIYDIPRIYSSSTSTYGYPTTLKTKFGYIGALTERRRVDDTVYSISTRYENEADNVYVFKMVEENYTLTKFGKKVQETNGNIKYYISTDNDTHFENSFQNVLFKDNVENPTTFEPNSNSQIVALSSVNKDTNMGYPQSAKGGMVSLASPYKDGYRWMIGRGSVNTDQGKMYSNTYNSSTKEWDGWKQLLNEDDAVKYPENISWEEYDRSKGFHLIATLTGSPTAKSYHGFFIPQGTTGATGTFLATRDGEIYLKPVEGGTVKSWVKIMTEKDFEKTESEAILNVDFINQISGLNTITKVSKVSREIKSFVKKNTAITQGDIIATIGEVHRPSSKVYISGTTNNGSIILSLNITGEIKVENINKNQNEVEVTTINIDSTY